MQDHPSSPASTPAQDPLTYPGAATLPARVAAVATAHAIITDLGDLIAQAELGEAEARVAARLAEETAELAAMIRTLPGRPREMPGHSYAAVEAITTAAADEHDFAGWLAAMLCHAAARLGGTAALTVGRPGSREAALVADLLSGTAGPDDENLDKCRASS